MKNFTNTVFYNGALLNNKASVIYRPLSMRINKKQFRPLLTGFILVAVALLSATNSFAARTHKPATVTPTGANAVYCVGATPGATFGATITVDATGAALNCSGTNAAHVITYQWYYNTTVTLTGATAVPGATGTFTLSNANTAVITPATGYIGACTPLTTPAVVGANVYFVNLTWGAAGTGAPCPVTAGNLLSSAAATVTVNAYPTAVTATASPNPVCSGANLTLTGAATGATTYAWTHTGGTAITTPTALSTGVTGVVAANAGVYTLTASNGTCATRATSVAVTVNASPGAIAGTPAVCIGNTTTLSDAATGGTWSSSVPAIGTINATTGLFGGVLTGTTVVTYSNGCGTPATVVATVYPLPAAISGPSGLCSGGSSITLTDALTGGTWSSSTPAVATATTTGPGSGLIVSGTSGTAVITYTTAAGCTTSTIVAVAPLPAAISGVLHECTSATSTLADVVTGGTWSSSTPAVATIDPALGIVIGVSGGTTVITYTTGCGYITAIDTAIASPTPIVGTDSVCIGSTTTYASLPAGGTWTSSTPAIGTVIPTSGVITGIAAGKTAITYTIPAGCFVSDSVRVMALPPAITGTTHACPGTTTTLHDASTGGKWYSAQTYIASVLGSTGVVTGVTTGVANITYTSRSGCVTNTTVTINPAPSAIIGENPTCASLLDTLYDATPGGVWSSGNTSIAIVGSATGIVTTGSGGTATISYTLPATGCFVKTSFEVFPRPVPIVTYYFLTNTFYTDTFYTQYQWYNTLQLAIPDANTYKTAALYTSYYWVQVTDTNGCQASSPQVYYNVAMLGVGNEANADIHIYPNPAKNVVHIASAIKVRAVISSADGKVAMEQADAKEINISNLATGIYIITLYNENGAQVMVQKLVKE